MASPENSNDEDDIRSSCRNLVEHNARFHAIRCDALKSCPELHKSTEHAPESSKNAEPRPLPKVGQYTRNANSRHRRQLKNAVFKPLRSIARIMGRRSASPTQSAPLDYLTPRSIGEQRVQSRDPVNMKPLPSEANHIIPVTPELVTTPAESSFQPHLSEAGSAGSAAGSISCISEPLSVQKDLPSDTNKPRGMGIDPQGDISALASKTTPCQPQDVTVKPKSLPTPLRRGPRGRVAVRSRLPEVTTKDMPSDGQELEFQQTPEYSGKESPGNEMARTLDSVNCHLIPQPPAITRSCSNGRPGPGGQVLDSSREVKEHSTGLEVLPPKPEKLCHPDTWTFSQGEPGDSDPFCPPTCKSRHSHEAAILARTPKSGDQQGSNEALRRSSSVESGESQTDCYFGCVSHSGG